VLAKADTAKHWFFRQAGNCCANTQVAEREKEGMLPKPTSFRQIPAPPKYAKEIWEIDGYPLRVTL
jgi:hypothetical protein